METDMKEWQFASLVALKSLFFVSITCEAHIWDKYLLRFYVS